MQTPFDQRANNFDFIRLFLAVLVIFSHSYPLGVGSEVAEPFKRLTHNQVTGGDIAVDLFFVISGFLISASYERTASVASYLKKRVLRIYLRICIFLGTAVADVYRGNRLLQVARSSFSEPEVDCFSLCSSGTCSSCARGLGPCISDCGNVPDPRACISPENPSAWLGPVR
jgi:hypothetical protein